MKKLLWTGAIAGTLLLLFLGFLGILNNTAGFLQSSLPPEPNLKQPGYRVGVLGDAQKKVLQLEDAVPQNKFNWRPAPGVRSIAEAYLHIAFGNYGLTSAATGKVPPADAGWEMNPPKWDKKTTDKAEIKKILEQSFAWSNDAIKALADADLDKKVSFFGHDMTARAVLIILTGHVNEHLGQEVAYARSNNVTPPWSEGKPEGKSEAKAAEAKK